MPEVRECIASGKQAQATFDSALSSGQSFKLEGIAVDATIAEARRADACPEAKQGLVYFLDSSSTVKRGHPSHQTDVFPPMLRVSAANPDPPPITSLVLQKITYTHRALILHFGTLFFMLQYLTHTSVQFYPRKCWENSLKNVDKSVRKFSIAVAFVFASHVLAFPSIDLVFQPTWGRALVDFSIPPSIYTSTQAYLVLVADWIENILLKPSFTRACDAIRATNTIFYGIGVYTVMELFFMAGLSPFLTLYEVFSNPSRAARFLTAFYSYIDRSERDLWSLLKPCIHDGILAPTMDQRLRYAKWLYVWAKDHTSMPPRMANLTDEYHLKLDTLSQREAIWGRESETTLYDVFEPTFVAAGLQAPALQLNHLIFGTAATGKGDAITALYRKYGLLNSSTMLQPDIYTPVILPVAEFRGKTSSHRPTFTFRGPKEMWSITGNFPTNSRWSTDAVMQNKTPKAITELCGPTRDALLINKIINSTLGVSIGPLEYCGVGHIVYIGTVPHVAVCKGDPAIPEFHEKRSLRGLDRISKHLDSSGTRKRSRSEKENRALVKKLSKVDKGYERVDTSSDGVGDSECTEPEKPKRRRLSADQRLALACI